eukprot:sb/3474964/
MAISIEYDKLTKLSQTTDRHTDKQTDSTRVSLSVCRSVGQFVGVCLSVCQSLVSLSVSLSVDALSSLSSLAANWAPHRKKLAQQNQKRDQITSRPPGNDDLLLGATDSYHSQTTQINTRGRRLINIQQTMT